MCAYCNTKLEKTYVLFFNACAFKENAFLLLNNINRLSTDCNLFSVAIVNGMLATELYLKFIMACDNAIKITNGTTEFIRTHDISELFDNLSKQRKAEIRSLMNDLNCDTKRFYRFRNYAKKAKKNKSNNTSKNGDVVNWRYLVVERKNTYRFDMNTMIKFNKVLYDISSNIINNPSLKFKFPCLRSSAFDDYSREIIDQLYITIERPE